MYVVVHSMGFRTGCEIVLSRHTSCLDAALRCRDIRNRHPALAPRVLQLEQDSIPKIGRVLPPESAARATLIFEHDSDRDTYGPICGHGTRCGKSLSSPMRAGRASRTRCLLCA